MQVRAFFISVGRPRPGPRPWGYDAHFTFPSLKVWHHPQQNQIGTKFPHRLTRDVQVLKDFRFVSIHYCQAQIQYIIVTEFKVKSWVYLDKARCICFIRLWVDSDIKVSLKKHWENRVGLNHVACWLNIHSSTLRRTSHFFPIGLQNPQNQYFSQKWKKVTQIGVS